MFFILIALIIIMLILNYKFNNKDFLAPSVVFTFSFLFCSLWTLLNYNNWKLNSFDSKTLLVIILGIITYSITCIIIKCIFEKCYKNNKKKYYIKTKIKEIEIPKFIKIITVLITACTIICFISYILKTTDGTIVNFFSSLSKYDHMVKFSNNVIRIPRVISIMITISIMLSYYYMYIFSNNLISTKKVDILLLIDILLAIILQLCSGGRNGSVNMIIALLIIFIIIYRKNIRNIIKISRKKAIIIMTVLFILGIVCFPISIKLVGRKTNSNPIEYLSIYCGAEIKNLDIYIKERELNQYHHSKDNQTFIYLIEFIGKRFGYVRNYKLDLPFRKVGNHDLGNVYTTFYQFIYDFGYFGVFWCTALMAAITQTIYEYCKRDRLKKKASIFIILYAYMFSSILFSFFSNKFYEQNFSGALFYGIIFWLLINYCLKIKDDLNEKINKKELRI